MRDKVKSHIDRLEGSQYLYKVDFVYVEDIIYYANFYQFNVEYHQEY